MNGYLPHKKWIERKLEISRTIGSARKSYYNSDIVIYTNFFGKLMMKSACGIPYINLASNIVPYTTILIPSFLLLHILVSCPINISQFLPSLFSLFLCEHIQRFCCWIFWPLLINHNIIFHFPKYTLIRFMHNRSWSKI